MGFVCFSQQIGALDLGDGLTLPLIVNFRSDRESSSDVLGKGWILALLDSSFVQSSENVFQMTQPDGWVRPFFREAGGGILNGGPEWKAEIKGNLITAWAGCGWRLVYTKGKLVQIGAPHNRTLEIVRSGGGIVEVRENGTVKLRVDSSAGRPDCSIISLNGKRIEVERSKKPRVDVISGENLVGGLDLSLSQLAGNGLLAGIESQFVFGVSEKNEPTLLVGGPGGRLIVWDPGNRRILKDGGWTYSIKPPYDAAASAMIERQSSTVSKEYWHSDGTRGREIEAAHGVEKTVERFTSGPFTGLPRGETISKSSITLSKKRYTYDETGFLCREIFERPGQDFTTTTFWRNGNPKEIETAFSDGMRWIRAMDEKGVLMTYSRKPVAMKSDGSKD